MKLAPEDAKNNSIIVKSKMFAILDVSLDWSEVVKGTN